VLSTSAVAEIRVSFTLDTALGGQDAPFLLPLDNGGYKAEGLNVSIETAGNALEPITRVASGVYDMGFADINVLIRYRDANANVPVTAVFMVYNRPAYAVIGRKSRGIGTPKDLEEKKIGAPAADPSFAQWPAFAKINGIDPAKVHIENIGAPVREPMLAAGQVDAITGLSFRSFVNLKVGGVPVDDIVVLRMAEHGLDLYGNAIIVNAKFATEHPEAVRGFLRAFVKGLKETVKQPARAVEAVLKRNDTLRKSTETERLSLALRDSIVTPEVKADGFGGIDEARFARALEQMALGYRFKNGKLKPADVFDASFLPSTAERKLN
jgi:NitT/TauT family transport system substrate-binding protein